MAFKFGNDATFQVDNGAGTLTNMSAYTSSVSLSIERDSTDLPRLGGNQTAKLVGPPGTEVDSEGWFDPTADAIFGAWQLEASQSARTIEIGPQGSASGAVKYSGEAYLSTYEGEFSADDPGSWSASFVIDENGLTRGTFS